MREGSMFSQAGMSSLFFANDYTERKRAAVFYFSTPQGLVQPLFSASQSVGIGIGIGIGIEVN